MLLSIDISAVGAEHLVEWGEGKRTVPSGLLGLAPTVELPPYKVEQ